ncbi:MULTISPECIES: Gfo/Idh/MocA family protein [Caulobacter]|uniref:Dehydrogenase n=1 Tax=Caulobacter rhizosphaerae TaxID=2010972 RepID=A0ABU1MZE3_9CAUL|nr:MULTISPECIES: Gfo/Idh/MocA family oxidoreductase [Caulobacter]MDR6531545.1 putative dehydrogenase [Caulobacter rhizosphaerae]
MTRVAVVGCGAWGRNLIRTCAELGVLGAVVDADAAAAQGQADAWSVPALPLAQALDDRRLDAMIIAAPAPVHAALCRLALSHGKDVFVEKPLASDLAEAEALAADVACSDRVFMVGHLLRHHPAFQALEAIVARGEIGALRYITASRLSLGRVRTHENAFLSLSPHDVSMVLALAGAEPARVKATGQAFVTRGVADEVHADLGFRGPGACGDLHAHIAASWLSPIKEQRLVVVGETGALVFDDVRPWPEKLMRRDQAVILTEAGPVASGTEPRFVDLVAEPPLTREIRHFIQSCQTRETPLTGIDEGIRVQRVLESVQLQLSRGPDQLQSQSN